MILINRCFEVDLNRGLVKDLNTNHVSSIGINEIELLEYFLSHPNELLSKKQLIDSIWTKRGVVVEESSLMNALSYCSKAFGDKSGDVIKTERGKGYRFVGIVDLYSSESESKDENEHEGASGKAKSRTRALRLNFAELFSAKWILVYVLSGVSCLLLGYSSSVISKGYLGPQNAVDDSYQTYDSCVYKTKNGDMKIDLGAADVISTGGISIAINEKLESVSFPSEIVGRYCE